MTRRLADLLLALAHRVAPPARRPWIEALRAEADLIDRPLGWAFGGFLAALGWSARREAPFMILFAVALYGQLWIAIWGVDLGLAVGLPFMLAAQLASNLSVFAQALAFAAWRPSHAIIAGLAAPMLGWLWVLDVYLTRSERLPVPWDFYLSCLVNFGWPAALGSVAGALIGARRLRAA